MKGKIIILSSLLLTLLTGCSNNSSELEKEVATLKDKVNVLEKEKNTLKKEDSSNQESNNDIASSTNIKDKITSFTSESERIVKAMNDTAVMDIHEENVKAYMNLKKEADILSHEIDTFDDRLEAEYKSNKLSFKDYHAFEKQLDSLDDQLDQAEDDLEMRLKLED